VGECLLTDFSQALCGESEVRARFAQVVLPESERPKEATNLEDAFQLLAEHAVELNITLHNLSARKSAPTKNQFAEQGKAKAGVQPDFCRKMYDLIKEKALF